MATPEIAVLVSSFQRPRHLLRVLHSLAAQVDVADQFEVVVTDDGSRDDTLELVRAFAGQANFPLTWTTHPHQTYQLARCRNEGVRASTAAYLLFLDGDCLVPPDHLKQHLTRRRVGVVQAGYCACLDRATSEQLQIEDVREGAFMSLASRSELRKLARMHRKARLYRFLRHPTKPKLFGGNVGVFRGDYEAVNGYDENFQGWGCEDDDLRLRLRQAGMKIQSILHATRTYHLWHPPGASTPQQWKHGANVAYLNRGRRPTQCERGLRDLSPHDEVGGQRQAAA